MKEIQIPAFNSSIGMKSIDSNHERLLNAFFPKSIKLLSKFINSSYKLHPRISYNLLMQVFSFSIKRKLTKRDLDYYARGRKETIRCANKQFNVYTYGNGPAVYLLHGWASCGSRWQNYVELMVERGFQVVVIDAPAHGTSPGYFLSIPDYVSCLRLLFSRSKVIHALVGHSIGALCGIVALNQSGVKQKCQVVMMSTFNSCHALLKKFSDCIGIEPRISSEISHWIPCYAGNDLSYYAITNHLDRISRSSLMIYDRDDIVVPSFEVLEILNSFPTIQYLSTYGLGHNLFCPSVRETVIDFIS